VKQAVDEILKGLAELPYEKRMVAKQELWRLRSGMAAADTVMRYERRDALISSAGNNAYAAMFAKRNERWKYGV
jgi:hypothetical protein